MKCPECGEEMEKGYFWIAGSYSIKGTYRISNLWTTKIPVFSYIFPSFEGSIPIMEYTKRDYVRQGFRCPKCWVIVINYGKRIIEEPNEEKRTITTESKMFYEILLELHNYDVPKLEEKIKNITRGMEPRNSNS